MFSSNVTIYVTGWHCPCPPRGLSEIPWIIPMRMRRPQIPHYPSTWASMGASFSWRVRRHRVGRRHRRLGLRMSGEEHRPGLSRCMQVAVDDQPGPGRLLGARVGATSTSRSLRIRERPARRRGRAIAEVDTVSAAFPEVLASEAQSRILFAQPVQVPDVPVKTRDRSRRRRDAPRASRAHIPRRSPRPSSPCSVP